MNASINGSSTLLNLESVSLSIHGADILHDVCLAVDAGETLGIIGESGSGKSLTALSILQLLPRGSLLSGAIRFAGQNLHSLDEQALCNLRGGEIGMVFQEPMTALNPVQTIGAQVSESIRLHSQLDEVQVLEQTARTLERVGLPNNEFPLNRYPHELSGGQRQRVVIAIAIACRPRLLIADEPTTALDVTTQAGILDLLRSLQREQGLALILITHDLAVVSSIADRIAVMKSGRVIETGMIDAVFSNPCHDYTKLLFSASTLSQVNAGVMDAEAGEVAVQNRDNRPELLAVTDLVCEYRTPRKGWFTAPGSFRAVDAVSFTVREGECLGLVGESGCGKSTLTRALLGLLPLHSGSIVLRGEKVSNEKDVSRSVRQQMQVVFQDPYGSFNPRHRVRRLIAEPLHVLDINMSGRQVQSRVDELLEQVGLHVSDSGKYIHEFSGGQRQRIAIARALIINPALIILDEAVSALDVSVRAQIIDLLHALAREHALAYLFISHDLSVVRRVTERVMVMQKGRIVEQGRTQEVFDDPSHAYTQQLIQAIPTLDLPEE